LKERRRGMVEKGFESIICIIASVAVAVAGRMNEKERASCIYVVVTLAHSTQHDSFYLKTILLFVLPHNLSHHSLLYSYLNKSIFSAF
jgi:hypothetical protein